MQTKYCYDVKWNIYWNRPFDTRTTIEQETIDIHAVTGLETIKINPEVIEKTQFKHILSIFFELLDENKNVISYETKEVVLSTTDNMINLTEKMAIFASPQLQPKIQETIAAAKLEYADYILT